MRSVWPDSTLGQPYRKVMKGTLFLLHLACDLSCTAQKPQKPTRYIMQGSFLATLMAGLSETIMHMGFSCIDHMFPCAWLHCLARMASTRPRTAQPHLTRPSLP